MAKTKSGGPIGNKHAVGYGAPKGNKNAARGVRFRKALEKAIAEEGMKDAAAALEHGAFSAGMLRIARKIVAQAMKAEPWAIKEIGDRLDGRPHRQIDLGIDEDTAETIVGLQVVFGRGDDVKRIGAEAKRLPDHSAAEESPKSH